MSIHTGDKPRILVILGPTAVGKSTLGVELSESVGAEIVNADSLQVYKHMNIGTAKPGARELKRAAHHLLDVVSPDEDFNAGIFKRHADSAINNLYAKGKRIVVVGGTYLYIKVLLRGLVDDAPKGNEIRDELKELRSLHGTPPLHSELEKLDPEAASRIHPNDYVRIERALEVNYLTGRRMSELQSGHEFGEKNYDYFKIGISMERESLYERINERVDSMIEEGFIDEVKGLRDMGYDQSLKPMQAIGYKDINRYLDREIDLGQAVDLIKRDTRRLAKRQMTWLRGDDEIKWIGLPEDYDKVLDLAERHFSS